MKLWQHNFPCYKFTPSLSLSPTQRLLVLIAKMEIELAKCECCGLKEDCTQDYINQVKSKFDGKWLCGLCSEAVRDEVNRGKMKPFGTEEAMRAHMSFCRKYKLNPAIRVADGMRQMLRRRSGDLSSSSSKKYSRSGGTSQVGDESSFSYY
ncbi:UPF0246 protein like [Actinidia chinensis var. chinensis]|uniref:UPF0246 protein like n=1 Tax=Actinidia chinensis var. chinensis TaxID=1590841 RepID=A0A2R6PK77_ACTCC|nr:UPF0246 protein like [Actinidia chinensis var. chinensis]